MTLQEALISFDIRIDISDALLKMEIEDYIDFCRYSLLKYFTSYKFRDDLDKAFSYVKEQSANGYEDLVLYFTKYSDGTLELKAKLTGIDCIDTYQ